MQKKEDGYIVIACDFTGTEWDEQIPMIEGHRGAVICLDALKLAIEQASEAEEPFTCTLCRREREAGKKMWRHPEPPDGANPDAVVCWPCINMADRAFGEEPDTDHTTQLR
mgnify:CR=1 FL=1